MVIDGLGWFLAGSACLVATLYCLWRHRIFVRDWRRERRQLDAEWRAYDEAAERRHAEIMRASTWYQRAQLGWSKERGKA
jgi:hypothetical protein